jgi:hypothetical protein
MIKGLRHPHRCSPAFSLSSISATTLHILSLSLASRHSGPFKGDKSRYHDTFGGIEGSLIWHRDSTELAEGTILSDVSVIIIDYPMITTLIRPDALYMRMSRVFNLVVPFSDPST